MTKVEYSFFGGAVVVDTYAKAQQMKAETKMPYKVNYVTVEMPEPATGWKKLEPSVK